MRKFLSILIAEYKHILKDQAIALVVFAAVIAYSLCYTLPYQKEVMRDVPVGIINLDSSDFSREFQRSVGAIDLIDIVGEYSCIEEAEKQFYRGKIKGFIIIPKNFEKDIFRGKQVHVSFYGDSVYLIVYKTMYTALLNTAMDIGAKIEISGMMASGVPKKQALAIKQPFEFVQIPLFNEIGGYKSYLYPVILILIFHQTLILALGIRQGTKNEKKEKYCDNDEDIPITILSRSTAYVLIYILYAAIGFLMFPQLFLYPMHYNVIPLAIMYILMMYSAAFFAQIISYFFKIRETVMLLMVPSSIIFIFVPGIIWPKEAMPILVNLFALFIPATCGIDSIIKLNQNGAAFYNILPDYFWLSFLCVLYYLIAVWVTYKMNNICKKVNN